jgi:hypothetical protein
MACLAWLPAMAAASLPPAPALLATVALAQADTPEARRKEADDLLRRARQALDERNWQTADSLVGRAEALGVQYPPFSRGDTPQLVRRDLDRAKQNGAGAATTAAPPSAAQRLSSMLPKFGGASEAVPAVDPFSAARSQSPAPTSTAEPMNLNAAPATPLAQATQLAQATTAGGNVAPAPGQYPSTGAPPLNLPPSAPLSAPGAAPASTAAGIAAGDPATRGQCDDLIVGARRALSVGDTRRAAALVEQAKGLQVNYGYLDDSPSKVEATMRKYNELMQRRAAAPQPDIYNRQYAELLLEQAASRPRSSPRPPPL